MKNKHTYYTLFRKSSSELAFFALASFYLESAEPSWKESEPTMQNIQVKFYKKLEKEREEKLKERLKDDFGDMMGQKGVRPHTAP